MVNNMNDRNDTNGTLYWLSAPSGGGKTPWLRRFAGEAGRCLTDEEVRGLLLAQAQTGDPALLQRTLSPWHFTSSDGRFTAEFRPILDRAAFTDFKVLKSDQHQVFGRFTGECVLDDGTTLSFRDFPGFAEQVENKW